MKEILINTADDPNWCGTLEYSVWGDDSFIQEIDSDIYTLAPSNLLKLNSNVDVGYGPINIYVRAKSSKPMFENEQAYIMVNVE